MSRAASRDEIVRFCVEYLKAGTFQDGCCNGMQVEGAERVRRIVLGVSLSEKLLKEAVERRAEMVIVHHGIFGSSIPNPPVIRDDLRKRLGLLLRNDITLCGFHLPLDAHPKIGNNAALCRLLGIKALRPLDVGFIGTLTPAASLERFTAKVDKALATTSFVIKGHGDKVRRVAVISGGAAGYYRQALDAGADTFLTGSINEWDVRSIEECGINFINAWHYNTEQLGVQNLGALIARKFGVAVEYVDVPCAI